MSALAVRARGYLADAGRGFVRAPVEVALALYIAVTFSWALEVPDGMAMPAWLEAAVAAVLVLAVAWTATLLHALGVWGTRTRWLFTLVGALVIALYANFPLDFERAAEGWRATALIGAAVLWLVALPAIGGGERVERMRRVDSRILLRLLAVLLYAAALYAGLALALAAVDTLFELDLEGEIYGHVFGWIFFVLVPWVVLGGLHDYVRPAGGPEAVASAVHRLTLYLVPPLLLLYFLILYAYMVRIAATGEVPKNLVSPMVLAAGVLTSLALLLFDPQPRAGALARGLRLAPPLFLPLAPLGAWALLLRIEQYGWTEFRALRLILLAGFAALALAGTVQLWRRRPFDLHLLPLTLAVLAALAVLGPWSVLVLSRHSQQTRIAAALARVAEIPADSVPATLPVTAPGAPAGRPSGAVRTVPAELYDRVQNDAGYLLTHFGVRSLPPELAAFVSADEPRVDFAGALGLLRAAAPDDELEFINRRLPGDVAVATSVGTLYRIEHFPDREPGARAPTTTVDSLRLIIQLGGRALLADLAPLLAVPSGARGALPPDAGVVPVLEAGGGQRGELVVLDLSARTIDGRRVLQRVSGLLLLPDTAPR